MTLFSSTKASLLAAFVFVIDKKSDLISAPHALVYFGVVIFFVYFKLSSLLLGITDPFLPFENLFCAICMGGVFDVIQETFYGKPKTSEENGDAAKPKSGDGSCNSFYSHSPLCPVSRDNVTLLQNKLLTAIVEQS